MFRGTSSQGSREGVHVGISSTNRIRFGALFVAIALVATGCSSGQRVTSLKVGDCFNDGAFSASGEIARVPSVSCSQPHDNEVFHVARYAGSTYSESAIESFGGRTCLSAFRPYVGREYRTSVFDIWWLEPTRESWRQGDREIVCVLTRMDNRRKTGTARGSGL